ncbi:MAG: aldehyde dehydrogenase family protein [Hyphomicrobiaceae bacterium]
MLDKLLVPTDSRETAWKSSNQMLIGGELVQAVSGRTFDVVNPATGEKIGEAALGAAADAERAVLAAAKAQAGWARTPARERGRMLVECGRRLDAHVEELAQLVSLETGKALRTESRGEASVLADVFAFYGGLGSELKGETVPFNPQMLTITKREPVGVVAAIIPWNAPLMLMALKVAPALAAGNTVVLKSAEEAPLAVLRAAQIMRDALPPGVLNVISGMGPDCGAPLVAHPLVRKITFTGSVETGRIIYKMAAEKIIPVALELGGKSPMIVCEDADIDRAVVGAVQGMRFTRQGQSCTAASRMFVHEKVLDEYVEKLRRKVDELKIGDPLDESTDVGTIISRAQYDKVNQYIALGETLPGAKAIRCSALPTDSHLAKGLFLQPVLFTHITNDSRLAQEEIFGPVTCIMGWNDFDEVIKAANSTNFGLAASVWTRDLNRALVATDRIEAGTVQVNQNIVAQANLSYGGVKNSGLGKEASLEAMLEHFTNKKTMIFSMA